MAYLPAKVVKGLGAMMQSVNGFIDGVYGVRWIMAGQSLPPSIERGDGGKLYRCPADSWDFRC